MTQTILRQGKRLCLRDWQLADLVEYERWQQPGHKWQETDGPYYGPLTPAELRDRLRRWRDQIEANDWPPVRSTAVISETPTSPAIGMVGRYWECEPCNSAYIGLSIWDESKWGRGLGTAALGLWVDYLFETLGAVRLGLQTWSGHAAMMRAAEKLGFKVEGRLRQARIVNGEYYDSIIMGLLKSEWKGLNQGVGFNHALLPLAAQNIASRLGEPPARTVHLLYSPAKEAVAEAVALELRRLGNAVQGECFAPDEPERLRQALVAYDAACGYVILVATPLAPVLFEVVGRPDQGIRVPADYLFCDWFMHTPGLIRSYGVDQVEQEQFRGRLLAALDGSHVIRVTTEAGTDLTLHPRHWLHNWGEVYTGPLEDLTEGTLVIDGSLYYQQVAHPVRLEIRAGRVTNLQELDLSDPQQKMLYDDLTRDEHAPDVAELGIGVNLGARPYAPLMEAEEARGTCHIGFGRNMQFGGCHDGVWHGDVGVLAPTITVDGRVICRQGVYLLD